MGQCLSCIRLFKPLTAALVCLAGLLSVTCSIALGQTPTGVTYQNDQLAIDAQGVTLFELLNKVASATGIRIDLPPETNAEKISRIKLGPGPAREVLAALLRDTHFNFLIAASDGSPERLSSVLVMPAETRDNAPGRDTEPPPRPVRGAPAETESVATRRTGNEDPNESAAAAHPSVPDASSPDSPSAPPAQVPAASTAVANAERGPALSPPAVLNQQSISTQLQQMYQQRAQMVQQSHQVGGNGN